MENKLVVVPGGTGNVGEGVVRTLLEAGARVVVPSRSTERLEQLKSLIGPTLDANLFGIVGPYDTFEDADRLANSIPERLGQITDVVSLIGGWWSGKRLWEISAHDWEKVFVAPATAHIAIARAFLPRLDVNGTFTMIAGFSSYVPTPGSGPVSMQGSAQLMMRRVLSAEMPVGPRINDVMLGPIINRSRPMGRNDWLNANEVGHVIAHIIRTPEIRDTLVDVQRRDDYNTLLQI